MKQKRYKSEGFQISTEPVISLLTGKDGTLPPFSPYQTAGRNQLINNICRHKIWEFIAHVQSYSLNMHVYLASRARDLNFGLDYKR